jgi:hypothetical protein
MYEATSVPGSLQFYIDGALIGSADPGQGLFNGWALSGYDPVGGQETMDMEVTELVLFDRAVTGPERLQLEAYFNTKYFTAGAPTGETWTSTAVVSHKALIATNWGGWDAVADVTPVKRGSAAAVWTEAVTSAGKRAPKSPAAASWLETITSAGKRVPRGTAPAVWTETMTAAGRRTTAAAAVATWLETLAAAGKKLQNGTAAATWNATPVAAGKKTTKSTATAQWDVALTSAGKKLPKASATAQDSWTLTAAGIRTAFVLRQGSAAAVWSETTTAAGKKTQRGVTTAQHTWTQTVVGTKQLSGDALWFWPEIPVDTEVEADTAPILVGTRFTLDSDTMLKAIRYYRPPFYGAGVTLELRVHEEP